MTDGYRFLADSIVNENMLSLLCLAITGVSE
jgi:hypothetical protein